MATHIRSPLTFIKDFHILHYAGCESLFLFTLKKIKPNINYDTDSDTDTEKA